VGGVVLVFFIMKKKKNPSITAFGKKVKKIIKLN